LPVNSLALLAGLRPWQEAGLAFLYHAQAAELLAPDPVPSAARRPASRETPPEAAPPEPLAPLLQPAPRKPVSLPPAWEHMLGRIKPAPVVWSYAELGEDLQGHGSVQRSELLRQMLARLRLPLGSNTFLPLTLPGLSPLEQAQERNIFAWLFHRLGGKALILLGQSALELSPFRENSLKPYQEKLLHGNLVLLLPDLHSLSQDARILAMSVDYLRSALVGFNLYLT